MKHVYISYSNKDQDYARRLVTSFEQANLEVWVDFLRFKPGQNWQAAMETGMAGAGALVVCLSPWSVASRWVRYEISLALQNSVPIIPIMIEECWIELHEYEETRAIQSIFILHGYEKPYDVAIKELIEAVQTALLSGTSSNYRDPLPPAEPPAAKSSCITPIRIFISSPGDLFPEREVLKKVINKLNLSAAYIDEYKLIPYAYEDSVPARMGKETQRIVDQYLIEPDTTDIFVCLFWHRMGTPTNGIINPDTNKPYLSGTEYEFMQAYNACRTSPKNRPVILLYRCTRPYEKQKDYEAKQQKRVESFFKKIKMKDVEGLYNTFGSRNHLNEVFHRDLQTVLVRDFD